MVSEHELPEDAIRHADGHPVEVAGYVISRYTMAPDRDKGAFALAAADHGVETDILGMWHCVVCRAHFGVNELDMVIGVPDPIPICPTMGCPGAGWDRVRPD